MTPAQQDELELLALKATGDGEEFIDFDGDVHDAVRRILAAVLPAHERQVREQITRQATGMVIHSPAGVGIHCQTCDRTPLGSSGDVDASFALAVILGHATSPNHAAHGDQS